MSTKNIKLKLTLDGKEFEAEIKDSDKLVKGLRNSTKSVSDVLSNWGNIATGFNSAINVAQRLFGSAKELIDIYGKQEQAERKVEQAVRSTGGAAGFSADELKRMASNLQSVTTFGDELILNNATAQLLTFTNIAGENFQRVQQAALDVATVLSTGPEDAASRLKDVSIQLGKALNDPVANLGALGRAGIQFSEEQEKVIKNLAQTNRLAEAQTIILDELNKQYGGQASALADTATGKLVQIQNQFGDTLEKFGEIAAGAVLPIAQVGTSLFGKLAEDITRALTPTNFERVTQASKENIAQFDILIRQFETLKQKTNLNNVEKERYLGIIQQLKTNYGEYLGNINLEKDAWNNVATAIHSAREALLENAKIQAIQAKQKDYLDDIVSLQEKQISNEQAIALLEEEAKNRRIQLRGSDLRVPGDQNDPILSDLQMRINGLKSSNQSLEEESTEITNTLAEFGERYADILNKSFTSKPTVTTPTGGGGGESNQFEGVTTAYNKFLEDQQKFTLELERENQKRVLSEELKNQESISLLNDYLLEKEQLVWTELEMSQTTDAQLYASLENEKLVTEERIKLYESELARREEIDALKSEYLEAEEERKTEVSLMDQIRAEEYMQLLTMQNEAENERAELIKNINKATSKEELKNLNDQKKIIDKKIDLIKAEADAREEATARIIQSNIMSADSTKSLGANVANAIRNQIKAYLAQAISAGIASIFAAIPFPINMILAAGAGAAIGSLMESALPKFQRGGMVKGKSHSQGGTPIEAEGGEFVVNKLSTAKYFNVIEAINNDDFSEVERGITPFVDQSGSLQNMPLIDNVNNNSVVVMNDNSDLIDAINNQTERLERVERMVNIDLANLNEKLNDYKKYVGDVNGVL